MAISVTIRSRPTILSGFRLEPIIIQKTLTDGLGVLPAAVEDALQVQGGKLELIPLKRKRLGAFPVVGVWIDGIDGCEVSNVEFVNTRPEGDEAIRLVSKKGTFKNNDFSAWIKRAGLTDILLGVETDGCLVVTKSESDLVKDDGINNVIVGGTEL